MKTEELNDVALEYKQIVEKIIKFGEYFFRVLQTDVTFFSAPLIFLKLGKAPKARIQNINGILFILL